jgi:hypothetical protein
VLIVVGDGAGRYSDEPQEESREEAGSIFACGAVDEDAALSGVRDDLERRREQRPVPMQRLRIEDAVCLAHITAGETALELRAVRRVAVEVVEERQGYDVEIRWDGGIVGALSV